MPAACIVEEVAPRLDFKGKKPSSASDQKTLKVRIKVGSDNLSTRKNAAIYNGLGLDDSPSSSLDDSPSESEGISHECRDASFESPTSILQVNHLLAILFCLLVYNVAKVVIRCFFL